MKIHYFLSFDEYKLRYPNSPVIWLAHLKFPVINNSEFYIMLKISFNWRTPHKPRMAS